MGQTLENGILPIKISLRVRIHWATGCRSQACASATNARPSPAPVAKPTHDEALMHRHGKRAAGHLGHLLSRSLNGLPLSSQHPPGD